MEPEEILLALSRPERGGGTARNDGRKRSRSLDESLEVVATGAATAEMEVREVPTALRARLGGPLDGVGSRGGTG